MQNCVKVLNQTVWASLAPSPIHGVGVFAIRHIPKGQMLTDYSVHTINKPKEVFSLKPSEFSSLHKAVRALVLDRTAFNAEQKILHFYSPNAEVCLRSFMNHSDNPNSDGERALWDIAQGEEITEDFNTLTSGKPLHPLTKAHYGFIGSYQSYGKETH